MADAAFWSDPRLQWAGSAAEMRDALLYWIERAPTTADISRLLNCNANLIARVEIGDAKAIGDAAKARRQELKGE